MPDGGVRWYLAPDDSALEPEPTWTQVDGELFAEISIERGRPDEFNRTSPGTATVKLNDRDGTFDPTNALSDWFDTLDGIQTRIDLWNPVAESWQTIYRGTTEDRSTEVDKSERIMRHEIHCVDGLAYLANAQAAPGIAGNFDGTDGAVPPESLSEGHVWFDSAFVDDRIILASEQSGWPPERTRYFSGNITVKNSQYDAGASFLSIMLDASDAEWPDVAVIYCDRGGNVCFHGRMARFTPEDVASQPGNDWNFQRWQAGDETAFLGNDEIAQIRGLAYAKPMSFLYNAALSYPKNMRPENFPAQVRTDAVSIAKYGVRQWTATDLIIRAGTTTGQNAALETQLYAQYIVDNYSTPRVRPTSLLFKSMNPGDDRAGPLWLLLTECDINDIIELSVTNVGDGGFFGDAFFVEGVSYNIKPANGDFAYVELTTNVSPQGYYNSLS